MFFPYIIYCISFMFGFVAMTWWHSLFELSLLCEVARHRPTLVTFVPVVSRADIRQLFCNCRVATWLHLQLARKKILLILSLLSYKSMVFLTISNMILLRYTFFMEKSERLQGKSFSAEMNDVRPFPEQQLFIFFAGKCKATQNKMMSCYIIPLFYYKQGGKCLILQTVALFTFLLYVTFLLRKSTHTHNFLHLFGNILEPFQGPWKGSQARLLMSK